MMTLDICLPYGVNHKETEAALTRTLAWAARARAHYPKGCPNLLFGIVQGGFYEDLRALAAEETAALDFDGLAIGGLSVGEGKEALHAFCRYTAELLPPDKPRYLMGVGSPLDIALGIASGIDMFDCVLPTRNARNGTLYTSHGKINIKARRYAEDTAPLDMRCPCYTCRTFSRAYLRHLFCARELTCLRLLSLHNVTYFLALAGSARAAIIKGSYPAFLKTVAALYPDEAKAAGL